jgi:magnesium and cobalt transporter
MSEERPTEDSSDRGWLDKLSQLFSSGPRTREDLMTLLEAARENDIVDRDSQSIFEGAIRVSDMQVREIMVPRAQMVYVRAQDSQAEILSTVIRSAHSRFPVIGDTPDTVIGILLAKDLLPLLLEDSDRQFDISSLLRPAQVVPESKRLNVLLREFRENRNHMVIVIDEYGSAAGLATIEDVLEEIVGDIEDEYDKTDRYYRRIAEGEYYVKALMPIEELNIKFNTRLSNEEYDTIGGLVTNCLGHLPRNGEEVVLDAIRFRVTKADNRQVHWLRMSLHDSNT